MKVSAIDKAIATFDAKIAILQKCIDELRGQKLVARDKPVRKAKKAATDAPRQDPRGREAGPTERRFGMDE